VIEDDIYAISVFFARTLLYFARQFHWPVLRLWHCKEYRNHDCGNDTVAPENKLGRHGAEKNDAPHLSGHYNCDNKSPTGRVRCR